MKSLIIFYSLTGNCRKIAKELNKKYPSDIIELKLKRGFKKPKMNFINMLIGGFQAITKKTPDIKNLDINLNNYDQIILGTPVWASTMSPAIRTFLKKHNIENKKIIIFSSYKNEIGKTFSDIKEILNKNNEILDTIEYKN
ncbi:flavodoxin [Patescibacteria group bacterium]|nr:flavodoxin [Patescibacteria group bacterium]